jgi:GntR family transcriptional regulator
LTINPISISKAYVAENFKPIKDEEKIKEIKEHVKKTNIEAHYIGVDKGT